MNTDDYRESMGVTHEQAENMVRLVNYLESSALDADFDMKRFQDNASMHIELVAAHRNGIPPFPTTCGTVGCAIGHGPYANIPKKADETWVRYSERAFGLEEFTDEWEWCFDSDWAWVDNTPEGAAARIRHMMEFGLPSNFKEQQMGRAPISY